MNYADEFNSSSFHNILHTVVSVLTYCRKYFDFAWTIYWNEKFLRCEGFCEDLVGSFGEM